MSNYSSSTKPGGNDTEVQYNKSGKFEGDSNLTWDEGNTRLEVLNGKIRLRSTTDDDQIELDVLNRKILLREGGIYNNEIRYSGGALTIASNSVNMTGLVQFGFPFRIVSSGLTYADLQFSTLSANMAAIEAWRDGNDYNAHLILQQIAYNVGIGPFNPATPAAKLHVRPHNSAERVSIFQGTTGQTANLTEWRDSLGTASATVNASGQFTNNGGQVNSEVFGASATVSGQDATAIGYSSYAGRQCVSLGMNAYSLGPGQQPAMALGKNANVNNYTSSAVGPGCVATASNQFVAGGSGLYNKRTKVYFGNGVTNAAPESFTLYGTSATAGSNANGGNVAIQAGSGDGTGTNGLIILNNLPTSDPGVTGALWNDSGTLKVS